MMAKIYFCLFCPQKFNTNDENILRNHMNGKHFEAKADEVVEEWIDSLVSYQTELNQCLSSEPKSLPKSSMCQSAHNSGKQKLLKGCILCDKIIDCFKLDINLSQKRKNVCICGEGKEVNKIVVICYSCKHMYHYPCVEPTGYSGEETSLYKCLKCKKKDFEISELSSESEFCRPLHVSQHFNYLPIVCKLFKTVNGRTVVCSETFFRQNFFKTHLKTEHNLSANGNEISNYYKLHSIPKVQQLIDSSLKKLAHNNQSFHSTNISGPSTSTQTLRRSTESEDNSVHNKRIRTQSGFASNSKSQQTVGLSGHELNGNLGEPPVIEPVSIHYQNSTFTSPPQLSRGDQSEPPVLINQSNFESIQTGSSQMIKRGRGRPKGTKSKSLKKTNSNVNVRTFPNCYVADGKPQTKSRLSEESRLSRPNISLSREQEKELNNKRFKTNNKTAVHSQNRGGGDESSDWDSDTEKLETLRRSEPNTGFRTVHNMGFGQQSGHNNTLILSSDESDINETKKKRVYMSSSSEEEDEPTSSQKSTNNSAANSVVRKNLVDIPSTESVQCVNSVAEEISSVQETEVNEEEVVPPLTGIETSENDENTNNEPLSERIPTSTARVTIVEVSERVDTPIDNPMISSPDMNTENEEPVINQNSSQSDWLTHTKPKKFPYFPQLGDEVVYIPYGHRQYINTVKSLHLYRQTNPTKYVNNEYINELLFAKVKEIKFEKHSNIRLTKLTLRLVENKIETNQTFQVKFHDIDNVLDFIILKQTYENSLMRNWKPGDSFRAIIEDKWWFGEIQSFNITENSLKTQFQALNVLWSNGSTEVLSYWDLEPIIGEMPQNKNISVDVTDEDRNGFYISEVQEWPVYGKQEECKRIACGLDQVMQLNEYKQLMEIFDVSNTEYVNRVPYLLNLSIVRSRVQNMFYRRQGAVKNDIKFLETNAKIMDPNESKGVVTLARIVIAVCLKFIDEHRTKTIEHIYTKVMRDPTILSKIKYYSCIRPHLNPNQNIINPLIVSTCAQIFNFGENDSAMNILTPSTTRPIVNTIRRSNDSEFSLIELSDSDEEDNDKNSEESSEHRIQQMVNEMSDYVISPTAPDSPLVETQTITQNKSQSQTSRPVVPVRAQPIEERSNDDLRQEFCDRNKAMDHYFEELKVKLKCIDCPSNVSFNTLEEYLNHNSEHKPSISSKTYSNAKTWVEKLFAYMDSLKDAVTAQSQINMKYGDSCVVCQRLNVLTPDSQPFFHKNVFVNNRKIIKGSVREEVELTQHMRKHLFYQPIYNCTLCAVEKVEKMFTSVTIDDNCRKHLQEVHQILAQNSDVVSFFGNNKILIIDNIIPDTVNTFVMEKLKW